MSRQTQSIRIPKSYIIRFRRSGGEWEQVLEVESVSKHIAYNRFLDALRSYGVGEYGLNRTYSDGSTKHIIYANIKEE